jgi:hypothetical protein
MIGRYADGWDRNRGNQGEEAERVAVSGEPVAKG